MMQPTEPRYRNHLATANTAGHCVTSRRSLLSQTEVSPVVVVVEDVLAHQTFQLPFIEYDHMIEQVSAAVADEGGWPTRNLPFPPLTPDAWVPHSYAFFADGWGVRPLLTPQKPSSLSFHRKDRWHRSYAPLGILEVAKYKAERPGHMPGLSF